MSSIHFLRSCQPNLLPVCLCSSACDFVGDSVVHASDGFGEFLMVRGGVGGWGWGWEFFWSGHIYSQFK